MSENPNRSGGVSFVSLLLLLFIGLKLGNVIGWSWWWVLAPAWAPLALVLLLSAALVILTRKRDRK